MDIVVVNALINFINTLDPNHSTRGNGTPAVFWLTWKTGLTQLLTFRDPVVVNITTNNFRSDAIWSLNELIFKAALKQ
ncbi:hypothetical protein B0H17DRAFT_1199067 [Mycena rosella]|uniref:Uncharacterized protein n=1 Tax=Mycena rosella TaxID=1033263 RepID=A0AAD7DLZ2_MYCRO|nr:hypothetical protein B0H17DRAFT_1199067 [Mycena rosella]